MSAIPREFVFTRYPARQGLVWLAAAYSMFKAHRLAWVVLVLAYFLVLLMLRVVPFIGPYAMTVMKPVLAVGLLAAAWTQERGGTPALGQLLQGFRANLWALLAIGVFFVAGITLAVFASSLVDGGKLLEMMGSGSAMTEEQLMASLADPALQLGMLFSALLSIPVVIATWWAPALVVFQDAGAAAALAASLRAAVANWKPLLLYGLGVFFYGGVVPGLIIALIALVVPPPAGQLIVIALLLPYSLFFAATLHLSDYVSYRDVFHSGETLAPLTRGT
ncbi:MAG: BPSS1780 family membrane protein [Betaproteobacteria bacterium]